MVIHFSVFLSLEDFLHEFGLLYFVEFESSCSCSGGRSPSEVSDFPVKQLSQPWIDKVPSAIVLMFLLNPINGDVAVIFLNSLLDMLMRERGDLLYSYNGNVLGL